jgi:formylglycine-generating enzyme required for sulfatase activity
MEQPEHPVVNVDIESVDEYIKWANGKAGHTYRLPSEAEWEYAARAGSGDAYSWGDAIGDNRANCRGCGSKWDNQSTAPVGSFAENPFGLNDMHGNVREWVADCWHDSYLGAPEDGSAWVESCSEDNSRSLRGGSWSVGAVSLRSAFRLRKLVDNANDGVGFRLARTLP